MWPTNVKHITRHTFNLTLLLEIHLKPVGISLTEINIRPHHGHGIVGNRSRASSEADTMDSETFRTTRQSDCQGIQCELSQRLVYVCLTRHQTRMPQYHNFSGKTGLFGRGLCRGLLSSAARRSFSAAGGGVRLLAAREYRLGWSTILNFKLSIHERMGEVCGRWYWQDLCDYHRRL